MAEDDLEELQIFHDAVREYIITLLLFIFLYVGSYATISKFKKVSDTDDCCTGEDAAVYRIALWLCTFTLAVSAGAVLLLPISIISNEVLLAYPHSYYVKWLNSSLIHGLWNAVFLTSNLSLFILMPFAYFFTESEGFSGSRRGIMARVQETVVILVLLAITVFGLFWVALAVFEDDHHSKETLSGDELCNMRLENPTGWLASPGYPGLYPNNTQCVWVIHVLAAKPDTKIQLRFHTFHLQPDPDTDYVTVYDGPDETYPLIGHYYGANEPPSMIESSSSWMYIKFHSDTSVMYNGFNATYQTKDIWNIYLPYLYSFISALGVLVLLLCTPAGFSIMFSVIGQLVIKPQFLRDIDEELSTVLLTEEDLRRKIKNQQHSTIESRGALLHKLSNGHSNSNKASLQDKLDEVIRDRKELEKRRQVSSCYRNLFYPLVMILLLALTVLGVLMVGQNMFQLLVGIKALPVGAKETVLGMTSLSALGSIGAVLEIILILYMMSASLVGFYSLPVFCRLRPKYFETSMFHIISNCSVLLILSSALPVLSRTLGITNFDLVGDFGSMDWLGNFYIIFTYNVIFTVLTVLCLVNKFTLTVRQEIFVKIKTAFVREKPRSWSLNGDVRND